MFCHDLLAVCLLDAWAFSLIAYCTTIRRSAAKKKVGPVACIHKDYLDFLPCDENNKCRESNFVLSNDRDLGKRTSTA
jgi:hypothetical protein